MQKEFTKADLKDGMVVEERNKRKYIVLGDEVVNDDGYNILKGYGNDLTDTRLHDRNFDIIRVFKVKNNCITSLKHLFKDENLELIWERNETKHMTAEEMRQKLEELTGEKIEVEPSREEMVGGRVINIVLIVPMEIVAKIAFYMGDETVVLKITCCVS